MAICSHVSWVTHIRVSCGRMRECNCWWWGALSPHDPTQFLLSPALVFLIPAAPMGRAQPLPLGVIWTKLPASQAGKRVLRPTSGVTSSPFLPHWPCTRQAEKRMCVPLYPLFWGQGTNFKCPFQVHRRPSCAPGARGRSRLMPSGLCPLAILSRQEISWKMRVAD